MKKGISLIVLVITIIVMIILAASVVLTLSNTGIIERANHATQLTNKNQLQTSIDLMLGDMMLANNGQKPNSFELVEELYSNNIITDLQKTEMLANGGELKVGEDIVRIDTSTDIDTYCKEAVQVDGGWRLRFPCFLAKTPGVEYTEFGTIIIPKNMLESYKPEMEAMDKFTLENAEELSILIIKSENYEEKEEKYEWVGTLTNLPENMNSRMICARAYAKYTYNGIEGVIYSDIAEGSIDTHKH